MMAMIWTMVTQGADTEDLFKAVAHRFKNSPAIRVGDTFPPAMPLLTGSPLRSFSSLMVCLVARIAFINPRVSAPIMNIPKKPTATPFIAAKVYMIKH